MNEKLQNLKSNLLHKYVHTHRQKKGGKAKIKLFIGTKQILPSVRQLFTIGFFIKNNVSSRLKQIDNFSRKSNSEIL